MVLVKNSGFADVTLNVFVMKNLPKEHPGYGGGKTESRTIPGIRPDPKDVNAKIGGFAEIDESFLEEAMKTNITKLLFSEHGPLKAPRDWQPKTSVATGKSA